MTSGSFLTRANPCQSAVWVRQSALGRLSRLRQLAPPVTENETEVSFFNRDLYENFKLNPQVLCSLAISIVSHIPYRLGGNVEFHTKFLSIIRHIEWHVCVYYSGSKEEGKKWIYMRVLRLVRFDDGVG
jgi:hypothetical protein